MSSKNNDINCSVSNLFAMSFPVICSIFSGTFMFVLDRIFLAHYSFDAMNGATFAHQVTDILVLPLLSFAAISEAFVGQFNGSGQFKKASDPILQISVFLLLVWLLACPLALYARKFFIPENLWYEGNPYYCISIAMIPFQI
ncbi:MAG: hypothetical protein LBJ89_00580, partial [Holosporales bacterium]|nr:hypothetical protein [Holosporales bacterium]